MRRTSGVGLLAVPVALGLLLLWANRVEKPLPKDAVADRIVIEKSSHLLTLYREGRPLRVYKVALGRNTPGPKRQQGDDRTPEGCYRIDGRIAASRFHRALHVSYPNADDRRRAAAAGVDPGGDIMIHGLVNGRGWLGRLHSLFDWTAGCFAVTNPEIEEIWRAVPDGVEVRIIP